MLKQSLHHFEPYVQIVDLSATTVSIAWGGFFFKRAGGGGHEHWRLLHDHELNCEGLGRRQTIGANAEPYGQARVSVLDRHGRTVAERCSGEANCATLEGLKPDTEYRYRIEVDGQPFTRNEHMDWAPPATPMGSGDLARNRRHYDLRFRTHPAPDQSAELSLAVIGDYGVGIHRRNEHARRQWQVAAALEQAVISERVRLVLTTGDNIYIDRSRQTGTGAEDDDWFYAFYQPYRHLLSRVPVYPAVGNHDENDTEDSDDRLQLNDNFHLQQRFSAHREGRMISYHPALIYEFGYGRDIRFICLDSSWDENGGQRFFENDASRQLLQDAVQTAGDKEHTPWTVVFAHHPPFCAGPRYGNDDAMVRELVPLFEQHPRCVVLSGHEHNFQYSTRNGVSYLLSGAGGKLRGRKPGQFADAHTRAWAREGHFLKLDIRHDKLFATPMKLGRWGRLTPLTLHDPQDRISANPIVIRPADASTHEPAEGGIELTASSGGGHGQ